MILEVCMVVQIQVIIQVYEVYFIRHGGALIGQDNEINGLTLGGVGTGTIIDNIEVVGNVDDGIEFLEEP